MLWIEISGAGRMVNYTGKELAFLRRLKMQAGAMMVAWMNTSNVVTATIDPEDEAPLREILDASNRVLTVLGRS